MLLQTFTTQKQRLFISSPVQVLAPTEGLAHMARSAKTSLESNDKHIASPLQFWQVSFFIHSTKIPVPIHINPQLSTYPLISICLMDIECGSPKKNPGFWHKMLLQDLASLLQRPYNQWRGTQENSVLGTFEDLLTTVKKRNLRWYGHVTQSSGLAKTILQGTVPGRRRKAGRERGGRII